MERVEVLMWATSAIHNEIQRLKGFRDRSNVQENISDYNLEIEKYRQVLDIFDDELTDLMGD